jgi:hypothetical protein
MYQHNIRNIVEAIARYKKRYCLKAPSNTIQDEINKNKKINTKNTKMLFSSTFASTSSTRLNLTNFVGYTSPSHRYSCAIHLLKSMGTPYCLATIDHAFTVFRCLVYFGFGTTLLNIYYFVQLKKRQFLQQVALHSVQFPIRSLAILVAITCNVAMLTSSQGFCFSAKMTKTQSTKISEKFQFSLVAPCQRRFKQFIRGVWWNFAQKLTHKGPNKTNLIVVGDFNVNVFIGLHVTCST